MTLEPYVPAPVPDIIANVDDATIPIERDSDLTDDEKAAKFQRGLAIRQATAVQFYAAETVERASFYELPADERRGFTLTFGKKHSQTFAMDAAPKAAAAPEEKDSRGARASAALRAGGQLCGRHRGPRADGGPERRARPRPDRVEHGHQQREDRCEGNPQYESGAESLAEFFAMEDRLETKCNAHAGELLERAKARLEHMVTDPKQPAKAAAIVDKRELIKKRKTAPSAGPGAWTKADFEELMEVAVPHEPRFLTQRCLGAERWIRGTKKTLCVRAALARQLEWIQHILLRTWAERHRKAAAHCSAVAAAAAAGAAAANH